MRNDDYYDYDDECKDEEYDPLDFFEGIEKYVFIGTVVFAAMIISMAIYSMVILLT